MFGALGIIIVFHEFKTSSVVFNEDERKKERTGIFFYLKKSNEG